MPKIPLPVSSASILGGGQMSTSVPASAFSNDVPQIIADTFSNIGKGIAINRKTKEEIAAKAKEKEDQLWLNKSLSEYQRRITDFEVDPANRNRPDYLPAFLDHAEKTGKDYPENAPSSEAALAFEEKKRALDDARYDRSASLGAENEMKADMFSIEQDWAHVTSSYHKMAAVDPEAAKEDILANLAYVTETIYNTYSEIAPEMSKVMLYEKIKDTALALSEKNPTAARELINANAFYIPEDKRKTLLGLVEEKQKEVSLLLTQDFNLYRERLLNNAARTAVTESIPLEHYQQVFQGEMAEVKKRQDDAKIAAFNSAHEFNQSLAGMPLNVQGEKAEEYLDKLDTNDELESFRMIVQPYIQKQMSDYQRDPVEWQRNNNKSLQLLQEQMTIVEDNATGFEGEPGVLPPIEGGRLDKDGFMVVEPPTPDQVAANKQQYYEATLRYQGNPVEGEDPNNFMSLPPSQRHLLTKNEANRYSEIINGSEIDAVIGTIKTIISEFPTEELQYQVLHDLATLPDKKISPVFQLAFQNHNETWLPKFIGNIRNQEALEKVSTIDKKTVTSSLSANAAWATYSQSMDTPENGRAGQIKGFREAIEIHASAMVSQGKKPKEAVDIAVNQLLLSTALPVELAAPATRMSYEGNNGVAAPAVLSDIAPWDDRPQIWLPKKPKGFSRQLDPEELQNYGRRMGIALANIHPDDVDPAMFANIAGANNEAKKKIIHRHIMTTGSYYPEPGGAEYIVTVEGEVKGTRTALRNKDGSFFKLPLNSVPAYSRKGYRGDGIKVKSIFPSDWSWDKTEVDVDYPVDDIGPDGFPKTGKFWQFKK